MENHPVTTKSCLLCGKEKSLAAYLQINGPQGTTYGNVCATCRGSELNKVAVIPAESGESESSSTGLKIDSKTKVQIERDKRKQAQDLKEGHEKEQKKLDELIEDHSERTDLIDKKEKTHRVQFLEPKKNADYLNYKSVTKSPAETKKQQQDVSLKSLIQTQKQTEADVMNKKGISEQEQGLRGINFSLPATTLDLRQDKYKTAGFKRFAAWVGESSPIAKALKQPGKTEDKGKDPLVEFTEKNWGPSSRNKR